jgi:hypothetical protein
MAINTTGQNLIDGVKKYVPEMQSPGHDSTILAFVNNERRFLLSMKQVQSEEVHLTSATDDIVADQSLYELPDDFVKIKKVMRKNADGEYKLCEFKDREQFRIWEHKGKTFSDGAFFYSLRGNHIDLRGTPDAGVTDGLRVDYWYLPDDWTSSTTVPQVWELFREVLEVGSALRAGIRREDRRAELERHYDGRLLPNFKLNFGRRVAEPIAMKDIRTTWRDSLGVSSFGRTR